MPEPCYAETYNLMFITIRDYLRTPMYQTKLKDNYLYFTLDNSTVITDPMRQYVRYVFTTSLSC